MKYMNTHYNFVSASFAFVLWGSWSGYINTVQHNLTSGIISGLAQGICSFTITLLITFLIEKLYFYFKVPFLKCVLPPILTILLTTSVLVVVHWSIHTPAILKTILPATIVAFLFACFTTYKINRKHHG